jgi:outer membrane biogenesis lipoprotein LolB
LVTACATLAPPSPPPRLSSVPAAFEMSGRISIRQAQRSDIAKLHWTHRAHGDAWVIASPLGNEVARIESDGSGATLTQAGGGGYQADSFQDLTERVLGVPLDPSMLAAWLHNDLRDVPKDWHVTVDETQSAGNVQLARRIVATRGDVAVRLVVDDYQPLQE